MQNMLLMLCGRKRATVQFITWVCNTPFTILYLTNIIGYNRLKFT